MTDSEMNARLIRAEALLDRIHSDVFILENQVQWLLEAQGEALAVIEALASREVDECEGSD